MTKVTADHILNHLQAAISWAADLRSSTSELWPTTPTDEEIRWLSLHPGQYWTGPEEIIILVLGENGRPCCFQRPWEPVRFFPQTKQTLIASIFHIDGAITVVLADGFEDLEV
jgi:hypothetical protein